MHRASHPRVGDSDALHRLAGVGGSFIQAHFVSCLPGSSEDLVAKLSTGLPYGLLGYPNVRNYDGSWTQWGSLVAAPVATSAWRVSLGAGRAAPPSIAGSLPVGDPAAGSLLVVLRCASQRTCQALENKQEGRPH
jgi:hypothetical protein